MDTYEIEAKRQRLNEAILASGGADLSAALEFAAHMSITDVVEALLATQDPAVAVVLDVRAPEHPVVRGS